MQHTVGKLLTRNTTFLETSSQSEVCMQSYKGSKSWKFQFWEFQDSHLEVPGQNAIWMWASWRGTKYTIRGKVMASPKSGPWWVLWVRVCPCLILAPKCFDYAITNLLFGLCRPVWVSKLLVNLPSLIPELQHAPPQNAASQGTCPNSLLFQCFHFRLTFEPIKEFGSTSKSIHAQRHVCY